MRSVVVVLPASMWAMIPMLRVFSSGWRWGVIASELSVWGDVACGVVGGSDASIGRRGAVPDRMGQKLRAHNSRARHVIPAASFPDRGTVALPLAPDASGRWEMAPHPAGCRTVIEPAHHR